MIGWKLALAVVAGIPILTTIGVYVLARFTHVFDAYARERAKLLVQFHNLEKLVEQTTALTATTEAIKARISDDVWNRQMRWNLKRDVYIRLMEALGERLDVEGHNKLLEQIRRRDPGNALFAAERDKAMLRAQDVQARLVRAACLGPLVISAESHQVLIDTNAAIKKVNYDLPAFEAVCDHNLKVLQDGLEVGSIRNRQGNFTPLPTASGRATFRQRLNWPSKKESTGSLSVGRESGPSARRVGKRTRS